MTNPSRQEIIEAHDALNRLYQRLLHDKDTDVIALDTAIKAIVRLLPPKPQTTMADVVWDDEKHFLAEAKTANGLLVAMLRKDQDQWISCIRVGTSPALRTRTEFEGYLTPTGKRYTLTEVHDG